MPNGRTSLREFADVDKRGFAAVASLHAHTHYSRESLSDVPQFLLKLPVAGAILERQMKAGGFAFDFSNGWWHPPAAPRAVFESEVAQIERAFGLEPLVSVTDHDDIRAGLDLQRFYASHLAPISFEWTVPFNRGFFHLGVHNLPPPAARDWFGRLSSITARPSFDAVSSALADLHAIPEVLVVFNHPRWDLADVGRREHERSLRQFLLNFRSHLHALELNGYRSWNENDSVKPIADATGLPLISGGDRHCTDPNAILNLTSAQSFSEFSAEVRRGVSHVVVMPEYRRPLATRILASASDVVGHQSLHWEGEAPLSIRSLVAAVRVTASPLPRQLIRVALEASDAVIARTSMHSPRRTHRRYALGPYSA
jgi:hypothetical protein